MVSTDNYIPKRSHSLAHHKDYTRSKLIDSQPQILKQQPTLTVSTTLQKSSPIIHQPVKLVRSSSLSHHSKKLPTRSNSLPQKPIKIVTPSPISPPFLFLQQEPPPLLKHQVINPPRRSSSLKKASKKSVSIANEEVTKALLEWKHKSVFKVDWATMFSPSVELWKMNDNIFGSVEDLLNYKGEKGQVKVLEASQSIWEQDEKIVPKKEVASYLGKLDPFNHRVLKNYLDYFDFNEMSLDEAFRKLCSKLYFKAEAQEIDRILEVFSHKYWNTNKSKAALYKTADVVYTITYSIMLLNTDLHLVQISSHAKMSSALFVENTMSTVLEQNISLEEEELILWKTQLEDSLKNIYTSVKSSGILQPVSDDEPKSFLKRVGSLTQRKKRSVSLSSSQSQ